MRSRFGSVRMTELTDELPVTKETRLLALARHGLAGAVEPGFCEPGRRPRSLALRAVPAGSRPGQSLPILSGLGEPSYAHCASVSDPASGSVRESPEGTANPVRRIAIFCHRIAGRGR
jgi:hypothetical protein